MTPREIRAGRIAATVAPGLWAFAYPPRGPVRQLALRLWCLLLRWRLWRELDR